MVAAVTSKTSVAGAARVSTTTQRSSASIRAPCRVSVITRASTNDNQGPSTSKALSLGLCGILAAGSLAFAPPSLANLSNIGQANDVQRAAEKVVDQDKTNDRANRAKLEGFANKGSVVNNVKDQSSDAANAVKGAASSVTNKVDDATSSIANKATNIKNDIKSAAKNVKNDLKGAVRQGKNNVDDAANNVANNVAKKGGRGLFTQTKLNTRARQGEQKLGEAAENAKDFGQKGKDLANKAADKLNPLNLK